jgi:hypothetical protein
MSKAGRPDGRRADYHCRSGETSVFFAAVAADLCGSRRARQRLGGQFEEAALVGAAELAHMREAAFHRHAGDARARLRIGESHLRERKPDHGEVFG